MTSLSQPPPTVTFLWSVTCFFYSLISSSPPSLLSSCSITSRLSLSYSYLLCLPAFNEKQLVCGVSRRAWPCVRVRPCDEMAAALIVWHGAAAALCQKSSSDSPTGMMAHLTNASPQSGPTMPGPTDRRKNGCGTVSDGYGFNSTGSDFGRRSNKTSHQGLETIRSLCVLQYILGIVYLYDTSTAVPGLNNQSPRCDHAHRS